MSPSKLMMTLKSKPIDCNAEDGKTKSREVTESREQASKESVDD